MNVNDALKSFGLNDREIKVYLALLDIGSSKVNEISEKADIVRETTYGLLKSLAEKNIVTYVIKSGTRYYSAADPAQLIHILKGKQEAIQEVLPELNERSKHTYKKTNVEFYEGMDGVKTVFKEIIRGNQKEIYGFANVELINKKIPYFVMNISKERSKKKIKSLVLMENSIESAKYKKRDKEEFRETRTLPLFNNFKIATYIFKNKVAFLTFEDIEPKGIIIENESIANALLEMHKYLWKQAKR